MVQKIPGILVVPDIANSKNKLNFELWITQGTPSNPFFFSNPAIRKAIEGYPRHGPLRSTRLGEINYLLYPTKRMESLFEKNKVERIKTWRAENNLGEKPVYWYEYFPYHPKGVKNIDIIQEDRAYFSGKGIALFAERIALRELLKLAPKAVLLPSNYMTDFRINQLKRRGMEITQARQLLSAREVFQMINKHIGEYRVKNRPKLDVQRLAVALKNGRKLRKRK